MTVHSAVESHGGWYQCAAQNAAGTAVTRARIAVNPTPTPPRQPAPRLELPAPTKIIEPE